MKLRADLLILVILALGLLPLTRPVHGTIPVTYAWRSSNYDPSFNADETAGQHGYQYTYWVVHANNDCAGASSDAVVNGSALHALQSGSQKGCYTSALAHQGHFPWMRAGHWGSFCEDQINRPDFDCPDGTHGIQEVIHSDFLSRMYANLSFVTRGVNNASQDALYNIYVSGYWWFDRGPATGICPPRTSGCTSGSSLTLPWVESQIRIGTATWSAVTQNWAESAVGTEAAWITTRVDGLKGSFGYSKKPFTISPGQNLTISAYDLKTFFQGALAYWSIPTSTHAVLLGYETGAEGYNAIIHADFRLNRYDVYEPDPAVGDVDFNHVINILDVASAAEDYGRCPGSHDINDWGLYRWNDDASPSGTLEGSVDSHCINIVDVAIMAYWYGATY